MPSHTLSVPSQSGAVEERHRGQVQDKSLDPVIEDPGRMSQELVSRQKV